MGREGDEQRHDQGQLAEELGAREVERDGHVRHAAPLVELELERDREVGVGMPSQAQASNCVMLSRRRLFARRGNRASSGPCSWARKMNTTILNRVN